jgi:hypothetical protein
MPIVVRCGTITFVRPSEQTRSAPSRETVAISTLSPSPGGRTTASRTRPGSSPRKSFSQVPCGPVGRRR